MDFSSHERHRKYLVYFLSFSQIQVIGLLVQFSSDAQSCPTPCNPIDCSMPGFPVHQQFTELAQTHIHWIGDAIQPSHPVLPLLLLAIFSSIRVLFSNESVLHIRCQCTGASASVLLMNIQDWVPLGLTGLISLQSKGLWRVFSNTTVEKHQFFGA